MIKNNTHPLKFIPNLSFWYKDTPNLLHKLQRAGGDGYNAVEYLSPLDYDLTTLQRTLKRLNLQQALFNLAVGNWVDEKGLGALPNQCERVRANVLRELVYARELACPNLHFMAGLISPELGMECFIGNLQYILQQTEHDNFTILIEPINNKTMPGYMLHNFDMAINIIEKLNHPRLKLLFDCYHAGMMGHNVLPLLQKYYPFIGHIQVGSVPDRFAPDHGDVDYEPIWEYLTSQKYNKYIGLEHN